jgi:tetratricopeptide (TPR) repeat protein
MTPSRKIRMRARILASCCLVLFVGLIAFAAQNDQEGHEAAEISRARSAQQQGDYKKAEEIYLGLLRADPGLLPAQFGLGATLYQERKYEQSNIYLLKALEAKSDFYPALLLVGANFIKLGSPARAVPFLQRAVRLQPADEYANHNLTSAEYLAGDYKSASADYIRYLSMPGKTDDVYSWYGLGEVSVLLARAASLQLGDCPPSDPYRLRFLASEYQNQEKWALAASRLKMLTDQPAWRDWARVRLGEVYLQQGSPSQAAVQFRQVLASNAEMGEAHFGLGNAFLIEGKLPEAALELVIAAHQNPWLFSRPELFAQADPSHFQTLAGSVSTGHALVDAYINEFARSSRNADSTHSRFFLAALSSACESRHKENERRIEAAVRPGVSTKARLDLATLLLEEGDAGSAADLLRNTSSIQQSDRDARSILDARIALAEGESLAAARALLRLPGRAQSPKISWWVSSVMQQVGNLAMDKVLKLAPDSTFAYLLRAQIEDARHHTAAAISEYQRAVQSAPQDPTTHFKLGDLLWQAGRFEEAIAALQDGVKLDPYNAAAYFQMGDSYLSLAQPQKAVPFLTEAIRLDPGLSAAYKDLGKVAYDRGNFQESVRLLRGIRGVDSDGSVHYLLFRDYSRLGNSKEATSCLKRFRQLKKEYENKELFYAELARKQGKTFDESTSDVSPQSANQSHSQKPN